MNYLDKFRITIANLKTLLEKLQYLEKTNPKIKKGFNMNKFGIYTISQKDQILKNNIYAEMEIPETTINGLFLGNAFLTFPDGVWYMDCLNEDNKFKASLFLEELKLPVYSKEYFPLLYNKKVLWKFLFSSVWSDFQPTYKQAIERFKYLIFQLENKYKDRNKYSTYEFNKNLDELLKYQKESFKCEKIIV